MSWWCWAAPHYVEHLTLAEPQYGETFRKATAAPATKPATKPAKKPATKKDSPSEDIDRIGYGMDRTERSKTVESEVPKSLFTESGPALAAFRALRVKMPDEARTGQGDWRHHSQRHILQIREIKHSPGFPSN